MVQEQRGTQEPGGGQLGRVESAGTGEDAPRPDEARARGARSVVSPDHDLSAAPVRPARRGVVRERLRVALLFLGVLVPLVALVWFLSLRSRTTPATPLTAPPPAALPSATPNANLSPPATPSASPAAETSPGVVAGPSPGAQPSPASPPAPSAAPPAGGETPTMPAAGAPPASTSLVVPVAGVRPEQLIDTYTQARSEGRTHNALDIMAPRGTPVLAAADGRVVKLFNSERGGITVYQISPDEKTVYYYAHLERYADGLHEGKFLRRGETLGYVGDTGNAGAGNYHLHFAVWLVTDPKRYWDGANLNPYPLILGR